MQCEKEKYCSIEIEFSRSRISFGKVCDRSYCDTCWSTSITCHGKYFQFAEKVLVFIGTKRKKRGEEKQN